MLGVVLLACTACCIPVVGSALAWLAVAGIGVWDPRFLLAGAVAAVAIGLMARRQRRLREQKDAAIPASCCHGGGCAGTDGADKPGFDA